MVAFSDVKSVNKAVEIKKGKQQEAQDRKSSFDFVKPCENGGHPQQETRSLQIKTQKCKWRLAINVLKHAYVSRVAKTSNPGVNIQTGEEVAIKLIFQSLAKKRVNISSAGAFPINCTFGRLIKELRDATRSSRWLRGIRKMGGENHALLEDEEAKEVNKGPTNTGKANNSIKKSADSATKGMDAKGIIRSNFSTKSKGSFHVDHRNGSKIPFQKFKPHKQLDPVTEMFNMLNKDYQSRARRRPPINNNQRTR